MSKGWSEERRKKQAEAIRKHRPWEKSTGPRTARGKAASSRNAHKHGFYGREAETIKALLRTNREFLALCQKLKDSAALEDLSKF